MKTKRAKGRKDEILDVATHLFSVRGFHGTRMDDVAEAAGLNKATVYHYYESKAELLFDLCVAALDDVLARLRAAGAELPPAQALEHYIVSVLSLIAEAPERGLVYFQESPFLDEWLSEGQVSQVRELEHSFEWHLRGITERGVEDGTFRHFDPRLVALAVSGMTNWFCRWYHPDGPQSPEEIAAEFTRLLRGGLVPGAAAEEPRPRARAASTRKRAVAN
jgi:AcrR family transcriptional regulator